MVDSLAKDVEKEKMRAIGTRNLLKSVAKQREAEQQKLQVEGPWTFIISCTTGRLKSLCAPDDYSTKNTQKCYTPFQSVTMITFLA
jgi:hypothetical protein